MNCNYFNYKVNLPRFCSKMGYADYQYVKLPTFGWYAYNNDKSFIGNIFDLVNVKDREYLYALISKEKPEYLDFDLAYSTMTETCIKYNLLECQLWSAAYAYSRKELETYKITFKGKRTLLKDVLKENGFAAMLDNKVGVITASLIEKFNMLPWPKHDVRGRILVPSFSTPQHICSLEYCVWDEPTALLPLWLNGEKGWYGNLESRRIVSGLKELWSTPGCTWDYKLDYWSSQQIVAFSDGITVNDAIRIWTESKNTVFDKSPLDFIIDNGKIDELKLHIGNLSYQQLKEVEEKTGEALTSCWKKARQQQIQIGSRSFTRRDNCYWVYKKGKLEQVTNFAIEIESIIKTGKSFIRKGIIYFGDKAVPFEMDEKFFTTNYMFHRGIKDKFLSAGLGVPIVHPSFFNKALLVIDSFNQGAEIDTQQGQDSSSSDES